MHDLRNLPPYGSLEFFLWLARFGLWLFPLRPDSKLPLIRGWQQAASRDPEWIKSMLRDDVLGMDYGRNVGALAWRLGDGYSAVVDVDVRSGGLETLSRLEREGLVADPALKVRTPTGGFHYWYRTDAPLRGGTGKLGPGVDLKSSGGYCVAAGSMIGGRRYELVP